MLSRDAVEAAGILRYDAVRRLLDDHYARRANYDNAIWALVVFGLWHASYVAAD